MNLVDIVDLLYVIIDICLMTFYYNIFFEKTISQKYLIVGIYLSMFFCFYVGSVYIEQNYLKTIWSLCTVVLLSMCWQGSFFLKVLLAVFYSVLGTIVETCVAILMSMIGFNPFLVGRESIGYVMGVTLSLTIRLVILYGLWQLWKKKLHDMVAIRGLNNPYWINMISLILLLILVQSYVYEFLTLGNGLEYGLIYFLIIEFLLVLFSVLIFLVFQKMGQLQQEKMQSALVLQQNEAQQAFYKESIEKNRQLKKLVHDEKNFLLGVVGYLKNNKVEQAIAELEQQVDQLVSNVTDYTGNIALDTVLSAKVDKARQHGITLRPAMALYGEIHVDFLDLVLILGNALDNAIEAASQVAEDKRVIYLSMRLQDDFLVLEVRNPVQEHIDIQDNQIATSKADSTLHGYGLDNMKMLTEKYNGSLVLECEEAEFAVKILLEN